MYTKFLMFKLYARLWACLASKFHPDIHATCHCRGVPCREGPAKVKGRESARRINELEKYGNDEIS